MDQQDPNQNSNQPPNPLGSPAPVAPTPDYTNPLNNPIGLPVADPTVQVAQPPMSQGLPSVLVSQEPATAEPIPTFLPPAAPPMDQASQTAGEGISPAFPPPQPELSNTAVPSSPAWPVMNNPVPADHAPQSNPFAAVNPYLAPEPAQNTTNQPVSYPTAAPEGGTTVPDPMANLAPNPALSSPFGQTPTESSIPVGSPPPWGSADQSTGSDPMMGNSNSTGVMGESATNDLFARPPMPQNSEMTNSYNGTGNAESEPIVAPTEDNTSVADSSVGLPPQPASPETVVPPTIVAGSDTNQVVSSQGGFPKWIFAVGGLVLLAVAGAVAYFVFGIGQTTKSEISQNPPPLMVPITPPPVEVTPLVLPSPPASTTSSSFGNLNGATSPGSLTVTPPKTSTGSSVSAIDLLRQRQASVTPTATPTPVR